MSNPEMDNYVPSEDYTRALQGIDLAHKVLAYGECLSSHTFAMSSEELAEDKKKVSEAFNRMVALATQIGGNDA